MSLSTRCWLWTVWGEPTVEAGEMRRTGSWSPPSLDDKIRDNNQLITTITITTPGYYRVTIKTRFFESFEFETFI